MTFDTHSTIGIIGGNGQMARLFIPIFEQQGFRVIIADHGTELSNEDVVRQADIVLFAVPIHKTCAIIRELMPLTMEDQLVMDITSLKVAPVREMLKGKAEVCGLHPMFGPIGSDITDQVVVMCPARTIHADFVRKIFETAGARVHETTPEEHDKAMSVVQVLIHFHSILTGNVMSRLGVDLADMLQYASPVYRLELSVIGRIFAQDPFLYGAIASMNPYSQDITKAILAETKELATIVDTINLREFVKKFEKTAEYLGDFKEQALEDGKKLTEALRHP